MIKYINYIVCVCVCVCERQKISLIYIIFIISHAVLKFFKEMLELKLLFFRVSQQIFLSPQSTYGSRGQWYVIAVIPAKILIIIYFTASRLDQSLNPLYTIYDDLILPAQSTFSPFSAFPRTNFVAFVTAFIKSFKLLL